MDLAFPVSELVKSCEIYCVADCCGLDAFNFSPIRIASFLEAQEAISSDPIAETVKNQLIQFRSEHGSGSPGGGGSNSQGLFGGGLSGTDVDALVSELSHNLAQALKLMDQAEESRWQAPKAKNQTGEQAEDPNRG